MARGLYRYFGVNALPFGAIGSVVGFLRISHSLWFLGLAGLRLFWTSFYDDYSILTREELQVSAGRSCEGLFKSLGIAFAESGKKAVPFSQCFKMLGLVVSREEMEGGAMKVTHTEERRAELRETIPCILKRNSLSGKEAERLRGRMVFFEGYTFGRVANGAVRSLSRWCNYNKRVVDLDLEMRANLTFLHSRVLEAKAISIERSLLSTWFVFTDGACIQDDKTGSVGGVLVSPEGKSVSFFASVVPEDILERFFRLLKNPIHELEVLLFLLAAMLWSVYLAKAQTVWYIDNESARMAMIRGAGETEYSSCFINGFVSIECREQFKSWFARVPSFSNIADGGMPAVAIFGCGANHIKVGEHRWPLRWKGECCGRQFGSPHCMVKK